jgi:glycosyltransferase involved in cell wall biosynthesis
MADAAARRPATAAAELGAPAVSVVVPVYNERENLAPLLDEIAAALRGTSYEVVAVDDGSTDGSGEELVALRTRYPALRVVRFARNAGQSAAFAAGFRAAKGAVLVTMDADLQNDPADVPALLDELEESGVEAAVGWRRDRQDTGWKLVQSRIANGVRNRLNHETIRDTGCSLKAFRREAVADIPWFTGMHRFLPTLVKMRGGRVVEVPVRHRPRRFGATKYGMWNRVFRALADALAVRWMQRRALRYEIREIVE